MMTVTIMLLAQMPMALTLVFVIQDLQEMDSIAQVRYTVVILDFKDET